MTNSPRHIHSEDTSELLSTYLDDALDQAARRQADDLIRTCPGCAADLEDLRSLHTALRSLPAPQPRRSFTLDPAQVRSRTPFFPIFRLGSLVAVLLLFLVLGVDTFGQPRGGPTSATAPAAGGAASAPAAAESYSAKEAARTVAGNAPEQAGSAQSGAGAAAAPLPAPAGQAAAVTAATATAGPPSVRALAAPNSAPADAAVAPSAAEATASGALRRTENAPPRTTTLETPAAGPPHATSRPGLRPIRILEFALALAAVGLGLASWWAGRRH